MGSSSGVWCSCEAPGSSAPVRHTSPHLAVMATRLLTTLLALACLTSTTSTTSTTRLELKQHQACYHQPYNRELVCQCSGQANYLNLRLSEFVVRARQEVSFSQSSLAWPAFFHLSSKRPSLELYSY